MGMNIDGRARKFVRIYVTWDDSSENYEQRGSYIAITEGVRHLDCIYPL